MTRLMYDTSMSLDGFITGPDPRPAEPLGEGGEQLHVWMTGIADFRARRHHLHLRHRGDRGGAPARPVLLDGGVRLFEGTGRVNLEATRTLKSSDVTHLSYRVVH